MRKKGGKKSDQKSYPKKELYFNVVSGVSPTDESGGEDDCKYEFKFFKQYPIHELLKEKYGGVNLLFTEEDISRLFADHQKGSMTYMLLTLLYPSLKYGQVMFYQDHLHPFAKFAGKENEEKLKKEGISVEKIEEWKERRNCLANLQMLEGSENERKSDTPLIQWIDKEQNRKDCQYLPVCSYELKDFETFMEERQKLMADKLKEILCSSSLIPD